jgi:predicted flap endonuclease-1-like 5' DNA nuclease
MATKYTFWVAICTIIATISSIFIFLYAPAQLATLFLAVLIASIIMSIISWMFIGKNTFFVLSAATCGTILLSNVLSYPHYGFFVQYIAGAFALAGFILAVLSVQAIRRHAKMQKEQTAVAKVQPYYAEDKKVEVAQNTNTAHTQNTNNIFEKSTSERIIEKTTIINNNNSKTTAPKPVVKKIVQKKAVKQLPKPKTIVEKKIVKVYVKPTLSFYDVKAKKKFKTNKYTIKTMNNRRFAVAKTKKGYNVYRILGLSKNFKAKAKPKKVAKVKKKKIVTKVALKKVNGKKIPKQTQIELIEGIGPKIKTLLHQKGIMTFSQLAKTKISVLKKILDDAGSDYNVHVPTTWPRQAKLAASGKWKQFEALKVELIGGKVKSTKTTKKVTTAVTRKNVAKKITRRAPVKVVKKVDTQLVKKASTQNIAENVKSSKTVSTKDGRDITINIIEK